MRNKTFSDKKKVAAFFVTAVVLVALTAFALAMYHDALATENVQESPDVVKVLIGIRPSLSQEQALEYENNREDTARQFALDAPNKTSKALISFHEYFDTEQCNAALGEGVEIERVFIWVPGKEGRSIIRVTDNNVDSSIESYLNSLDYANSDDEVYKADMEELVDNYKIFAVTINGTNTKLSQLCDDENMFVNLVYSEPAEQQSKDLDIPISYICAPLKPDIVQ
ncbi:hypothetical protein FACS1894202_09280 [Clostridia bacterium]|nr:hypothetical protein FACS1894202_09280 [Clostridia bacterium]